MGQEEKRAFEAKRERFPSPASLKGREEDLSFPIPTSIGLLERIERKGDSIRFRVRNIFIAALWGISLLKVSYGVDDSPFFKAQTLANPKREVSLIVTSEGFYPPTLTFFAGERVHFFVTATTETKECFLIKGKSIFLSAEKGKLSEGSVLFNGPGVFSYYCPTNKFKGKITVLPQREKRKGARERKMAQENIKIWMPRESEKDEREGN